MSDLEGFSKGLEIQAERRAQEREELNKKLGEPVRFIADKDANDSRFGVGFWAADGGVVTYRRYANGYDPFSRVEYSNELIDLLEAVRGW